MADHEAAAQELRDLIREGHALLKDMRAERRVIEQLLDGIPAKVDGRIKDALKAGLVDLSEAVRQATDTATVKVFARFDRLTAILTGTDPAAQRAGKPPLEELLRNHAGGADRG